MVLCFLSLKFPNLNEVEDIVCIHQKDQIDSLVAGSVDWVKGKRSGAQLTTPCPQFLPALYEFDRAGGRRLLPHYDRQGALVENVPGALK